MRQSYRPEKKRVVPNWDKVEGNAVRSTAGIRPSLHRSSQSHTGLNKKLNKTASARGMSIPFAKLRAATSTAIDASVNTNEDLVAGNSMGSSLLCTALFALLVVMQRSNVLVASIVGHPNGVCWICPV